MSFDLPIIEVDFNEMTHDGLVVSSERFVRGCIPSIGDRVWLETDEGTQCSGEVARISSRLLYIRPDHGTKRTIRWAAPTEGDQ